MLRGVSTYVTITPSNGAISRASKLLSWIHYRLYGSIILLAFLVRKNIVSYNLFPKWQPNQ